MNYISENIAYTPLIIPTVLIPFTMLSVGLSVIAAFIAGFFGVKLKTEGPKQLLELLLKPKVLIGAIVINLVCYGGYKSYLYINNLPSFDWTIDSNHVPVSSTKKSYSGLLNRPNTVQESVLKPSKYKKINQDWLVKLPMGAFRAGAVSGDSIFIGADDGYIHELSLTDGHSIRRFYIGTIVTPSPVIYNGMLFSGEGTHDTHHARIYKINLTTGMHEKYYTTKGHTEGQPVISEFNGKTLLFAVAGSDGVHAIDPNTMTQVWHQNPGHIDAAVRVEDNIVYVGTGREKGDNEKHRSYAIAYDFTTGKELWKNELPASSWMEPALTNDYACFVMGEIYFDTKFGGVNCYDKLTGEPEFSILNDSPVIGIPMVLGKDIIYSDYYGKVCRIDVERRMRAWCFDTKVTGKQMTSVSYNSKDNILSYTTANSGIYFLNPKSGELIYHYSPSEKEGKWKKTYASANPLSSGWITVDIEGNVRRISPAYQ